MRLSTIQKGIAAGLAGALPMAAAAQELEVVGQPLEYKMGFQPAATELARDLQGLDHLLLVIITVITVFVTALLIYAIVRYSGRVNKVPAKFTHNSPLEIAWTVVPILVLVFIGAFSLPVLFKQQEIPVADVTIKVTGNQWYWTYEYADNGIAFDSYMIGSPATGGTNQMTPEVEQQLIDAGYSKEQFLLATDTAVVVPVGKIVVMQVTAADVIHSWKIPAFGVMQDGVPGRLAHLWFKAEREGIYFGQCSELCGQMHAYMPITVKVVSQPVYDAWVAKAATGDVVLSAADMAAGQPIEVAASN
jgi:cytochrome c oxidase subunit 2